MRRQERLDGERLVTEFPLFLLLSLPRALGRKPPHTVMNDIARAERPRMLRESLKLSKLYTALSRIYVSDIAALNKLSERVNDNFLSRLLREYTLTYVARGVGLDTLSRMTERVTMELRTRVASRTALLLQWVEAVAMIVVLASLIMMLSGMGRGAASIVMLATLTTLVSLALVPFARLPILEVYASQDNAVERYVGTAAYLVLLTAALWALLSGERALTLMCSAGGLAVSAYTLTRAYESARRVGRVTHTLRLAAELLSVRAASPRIADMMANDPEVPRELVYVLRTGRSPGRGEGIEHLIAEVLASIIRSGGKALAAIRLCLSTVEEVYNSIKKVFANALAQLALLAGSTIAIEAAFKYAVALVEAKLAALPLLPMPVIQPAALAAACRAAAVAASVASCAIAYSAFGKRVAANFAAPIVVAATALLA